MPLLQLGVLGLGFFQGGEISVGIFPEREEILVGGAAVATIQNLGTHPGLATGMAMGQTTIMVSFAQGSSSVTASTNLTVTP